MTFYAVCIALPAAVFIAFYIYRKYFCHNYFKKLGVPGPEPHWFYGNLDLLWATEERHLVLKSWAKKYGKIYGFYEGCTPILVVACPDGVEQVCIKQFRELGARKSLPFFPDVNKFPESPFYNVSNCYGERWKRLRGICNPGFSPQKLKAYTPLVMKSQLELEELLTEFAESGETFNIYPHFNSLALDVISEVAYGLELNSVKNRSANNPIWPKLEPLIETLANEAGLYKICLLFPELISLIQNFMVFQMKFNLGLLGNVKALGDISVKVLAQRKADPSQRRVDVLQLLIDASESTQLLPDGTEVKPLTPLEIRSQTLQFFGAGSATTASAMSCVTYLLSKHPVEQERLYNEVIEYFPDGESAIKPDYDAVMKMPYLDRVVSETLRMFPIGFPLMSRWANEVSTSVCGVPVEKEAVTVQIDGYTIHQDPEYWGPVDPALFHPDRFSAEYPTTNSRPTFAYIPFGAGPRTCLGMRLALFEIKLTMITILHRFRILPAEGARAADRLVLRAAVLMLPKSGVWVRLQERKRKAI